MVDYNPELAQQVEEWIAHDPSERSRAELQELLNAYNAFAGKSAAGADTGAAAGPVASAEHMADHESAANELAARFSGPLQFGTAGLRGRCEAGESRMNLATVTRATSGLAAWLTSKIERPVVVVGCDARHGSAEFHQAAAEVFSAAGCEVHLLPAQRPTPLTAYCVRALNADAGVMVTASHNPPKDNGYKVYLGGRVVDSDAARGVQLISPADSEIATAISHAPFADQVARTTDNIRPVSDEVIEQYLTRVVSLRGTTEPADLPIVFTAMHGVGGDFLETVLRRAGFTNVTAVAEQRDPDPEFPTVSFPNPEEPGALDCAYATAERVGARIILALDPDADRCSVAIPTARGWRQLSGDEVGAILAEDCARRMKAKPGTLACSLVSSRLMERIAPAFGLDYAQTLTGFKWIARTPNMVFGYEEALGYCTDPEYVRDKDGISACLRVASIAQRCADEGTDLEAYLQRIANEYGLHLTSPLTFRVADPSITANALARLQSNPPAELAGARVTEFTNLSDGFRGLPPTTGFWILTERNDRIVVRPSGTEPKLKCYLEVVAATRDAASIRLEELKRDLAQALGL